MLFYLDRLDMILEILLKEKRCTDLLTKKMQQFPAHK